MRIFLYEPMGQSARDALASHKPEFLLSTEGAEVFWCGLWPLAIEDVPPSVRYVVCPATGTDHLPVEALTARGCQVISLAGNPGLRDVPATAELTIALMLAMQRRLPVAWHREAHERHPDLMGNDLRGKRVAVVGYGRVGKMVVDLLWAFKAIPMGIDSRFGDLGPQFAAALPVADIVTLHVDLNPTSVGLIGRKELAMMKPGALLVNTSRGAVVDERALCEQIVGERLRAALDVMVDEVNLNRTLLNIADKRPESLLLTPHLGGFTAESTATAERLAVERLLEVWKE